MQQVVHHAHVAPWKKEEVKRLQELIRSKPVVAIVQIGGIPSPQMLAMRSVLRQHGDLKSAKNNLFERAFTGLKDDLPGIEKLVDRMEGQCALLVTDDNPFKLYKQLQASKQMMPAKAGQIAPMDITVEKGDTPFKPGPIVGELQKGGIPAAIEKGKVVIKKTQTVVKQGEAINADLALGLQKLEIFPIEVGIKILGVYEEGFIFKGADLKIDEVAFGSDLVAAIKRGINLGVNAPVYEREIAPLIVAKAHREALNLAVEAGILNKTTVPFVLGKATRQALGIAGLLSPEALDEDLKEKLAGAAAAATAAPAAAEEKKEEEEEEEEAVSEEDAAAGLGALFG